MLVHLPCLPTLTPHPPRPPTPSLALRLFQDDTRTRPSFAFLCAAVLVLTPYWLVLFRTSLTPQSNPTRDPRSTSCRARPPARLQDIDPEMVEVHRFVVDRYSRKFPELDSLIPQPADYIRTVQVMKNEMVGKNIYIYVYIR